MTTPIEEMTDHQLAGQFMSEYVPYDVDPTDQYCWDSLICGWLLGKGVSTTFAVIHARPVATYIGSSL